MEKDRHKYGFHCAGLKRAFFILFPFFSWIARQRNPSNTNRPSILVALNPYVYADEIAKCEEFASAEFGPCSCLPCPQWISFDHFWSINQESPRTQNISKGPLLDVYVIGRHKKRLPPTAPHRSLQQRFQTFLREVWATRHRWRQHETATNITTNEASFAASRKMIVQTAPSRFKRIRFKSPGEAWEQGLQHRKRLCSRAFVGLL